MGTGEIDVVGDVRASLGEGPVWDSRIDRLVWVDIFGRSVHLTDPTTGSTESLSVPSHVGCVAPRQAGGYIAALRDGFWIVGDGAPRRVAAVEVGAGVRFNDGKCDPAGRFWAGTMAYDDEPAVGALFRLDPDLSVSKQLSDVTISNGLAWSGDQRTMYYIDTPTRRVDRFAFDPESGFISDRQTFVEIPETSGYPDGMTIDAEEGLWIAMWDGSRIERYVNGRLERVLEMPVSRPTSIAFGGSDYDEMFVTSASTGLTDEERAKQPLAGALFRIRPGVVGVPPVVFEGA